MRKFSLLFIFFLSAISFAQTADSTAVAVQTIKTEEITVFPCTVNRIPMKFIVDTLNYDVKISLIDADYLFKNNSLLKEDLRMEVLYDFEKKGVTAGMKFNLKEIAIGGLILNNIDVLVVKDQEIPLIFGTKILSKLGKVNIENNNFVFGNLVEPYSAIKFDLTNEEFSASQRTKLIDDANQAIRNSLVANLRRFVRGNEKNEAKELRVSLTFKIDMGKESKNDQAYNEEIELNQKTVAGKMMYETFKLINTSEETKAIMDYYDTTTFNLVFIYIDKTIKLKYTLPKDNLSKLPIPYTKEEFLQSLTTSKK
ncbi:MAG: retroviral-like aspartic protease family protein [Flavobacterium sp.]|uniref:retroviral-like aspartic protease family protein n=1 Tax=Flavobacterium sp. TaxID=239 RepID=UPI0022BB8C88|nr:retroviral-like aspartic protease family protein [Flavobacterium sp.]MCZ8196015.1 retroviral-like aspartic protease family protein [Flavobacterium sp.]